MSKFPNVTASNLSDLAKLAEFVQNVANLPAGDRAPYISFIENYVTIPAVIRAAVLNQIKDGSVMKAQKRPGRPRRLKTDEDFKQDALFQFMVEYLIAHPKSNRNQLTVAFIKTPHARQHSISREGLYARVKALWEPAKKRANERVNERAERLRKLRASLARIGESVSKWATGIGEPAARLNAGISQSVVNWTAAYEEIEAAKADGFVFDDDEPIDHALARIRRRKK